MGFITKPVITRKVTKLAGKPSEDKVVRHRGGKRAISTQPEHGLITKSEANKLEIKREVKILYDVTAVDVNMIHCVGKRQARCTKAGLVKGQKNAFKKVIVTSKSGNSIDFYSNI